MKFIGKKSVSKAERKFINHKTWRLYEVTDKECEYLRNNGYFAELGNYPWTPDILKGEIGFIKNKKYLLKK